MAKQTPNLKLYKVDPETDGDMSFNIETMLNENWDKVDEGFEQLQDNLSQQESDYVRKPGYSVTSGTGNAYIVTTDPAPAAYVDGMGIVIRANRANTGAATLNWNGLGAIPIVDAKGNPVTAGKIPNGARLTLRYSASTSNFQLQGEGGEYGTATQAEVMQGYTIGTEEGVLSGTLALTGNATQANVLSGKTYYATNPKIKLTGGMADYSGGGANQNPVKASTVYCYNNSNIWNGVNTLITVPPGYYANAHSIGAVIKNLSPENIKHGVNISDNQPTNSGCVGTFTSDGTILASDVLSGKKGYSKGVPITGTMPNRGAVTNTITAQGGQYTIPAGYHNGSGKVTASFPNLIPGNVRQGVNIGGVVGSLQSQFKSVRVSISKFPSVGSGPTVIEVNSTLFNFNINTVILEAYIMNGQTGGTSPETAYARGMLTVGDSMSLEMNGEGMVWCALNSFSQTGTTLSLVVEADFSYYEPDNYNVRLEGVQAIGLA